MTVRELESVLPKSCTIRCYGFVNDDLVFISHGSIHPCEGNRRKHIDDEIVRIITSDTKLMSGVVDIWVKE